MSVSAIQGAIQQMSAKRISYSDEIILTNPLFYWPLNELAGANAINYGSVALANGTHTNVTLNSIAAPGKTVAPLYNGLTSFTNVYSAALNTNFPRTVGSMMVWFRVAAAGVWIDSTVREPCRFLAGASYVIVRKSSINNTIAYFYGAKTLSSIAFANTNWNCMALTWTDPGDELIWYINGVQVGATQTGVPTFTGNLLAAQSVLGASSTTPSDVWSGYLAHFALWGSVLTPAQASALYNGGL